MKPREYYKPYINVKNPKVAANIEFMAAKHRPSTVKKKEPDPKSIQSLKRLARLNHPKVTSKDVRNKLKQLADRGE